jgi:hypothetical protein
LRRAEEKKRMRKEEIDAELSSVGDVVDRDGSCRYVDLGVLRAETEEKNEKRSGESVAVL